MRRPGAVDDDRAGCSHREAESAASQLRPQALAIGGGIPSLKGGRPNVGEPDAGAGFHQPFLRRHRDGTFALDQIVLRHPRDDVLTAFLNQPVRDTAGVRSRRRLQPELEGDGQVHIRPAGVVVLRVDAAAIGADEAVDPVLVQAGFLIVLRADIAVRGQLELPLEGCPPGREDGLAVQRVLRRVDVHMVAGAIRAASAGGGDELGELLVQIATRDHAAGCDDADGLADFGFQEMSA